MKYLRLLLPLFFSLGLKSPIWTQADSAAAVLTVLPVRSSGYEPVFSPFCPDIVWLGDRAYSFPERRFLSVDSTVACLPAAAVHMIDGSNPAYPYYIWWNTDPYSERYYWAGESWSDSLFLWRYDRQESQKERFVSQAQGYQYLLTPAGLWLSKNQEMVLLDRNTGQELRRVAQAENASGYSMNLRAWGKDLLVSDHNIYSLETGQYSPFFPFPAEMQDCRSPDKMQIYKEVCGSWYQNYQENDLVYFLSTPDHVPVRLPFSLNRNGVWMESQILASNPPLTWFYFPDRLLAFNLYTGDSLVYPGPTGIPIRDNQDGRFMVFFSEKGLSFFDKEQCQFRVLDRPYGYRAPHHFACFQGHIILTYEDRWEIIDFNRLNPAFKPALIQEEYELFRQECSTAFQENAKDFESQYAAYMRLYDRYRNNQNPKIAEDWDQAKGGIANALYYASDSLLEAISAQYNAGKYDHSISCELVKVLFNYYGYRGDLAKAQRLLSMNDNASCVEEKSDYGLYCIDLLHTTLFRLDSVKHVKQSTDQRLYALGRVWWDYCYNKRNFRYSYDPRGDFGQAHDYYRQVLQAYPQSPWADNAAYDTMYYIDYHATTTDDETPDGNDAQAFEVFTQFLQDYPNSDRRPDVLLRLATVVQRGLIERYNTQSGREQVAGYLQIIERDYPDFTAQSEVYQRLAAGFKRQEWASRWRLLVFMDKSAYKATDTIRVTIQFQNISRTVQSLDTSFLNSWSTSLFLHLFQARDQGCEDRSGDFPLIRQNLLPVTGPITVLPGNTFSETFIMGHTSQVRGYGSKVFTLATGRFSHFMEYRHPVLKWISLQEAHGENFSIE